jgi:hypothetical protein
MLADPDMAEMAQEEIASAEAELLQLEDELQRLLLPKDPDDARNAFVEIRAGTGGDESALFAGDLRACTPATPNAGLEGGGHERIAEASWAATRKWCCASKVTRPTAQLRSNRAATACSACPPPKPRAASTPAPAPWP